MKIIFGTKTLGKEDGANGAFQKYTDKPVVTLEGVRGHGKSRRFLFNALACEILGLEKAVVQHLVFGALVDAEEKSVLISNTNNIVDLDGLTTYRTSKNYVSYDDSKEKGKAVSSSKITGDMSDFLGLDDSKDYEFIVEMFEDEDIEAVRLVPIEESTNQAESLIEEVPFEAEVAETVESEELDTDKDWNEALHPYEGELEEEVISSEVVADSMGLTRAGYTQE